MMSRTTSRCAEMIRLIGADLAERIDECGDGSEACACYSARRPDWVLMDIQMGECRRHRGDPAIVSDHPGAKGRHVTTTTTRTCGQRPRRPGLRYVLRKLLKLRQLLIGKDEQETSRLLSSRPACQCRCPRRMRTRVRSLSGGAIDRLRRSRGATEEKCRSRKHP